MSLCCQASVNNAFTLKSILLTLQALQAEKQASDNQLHQAQATNDGLTGKLSSMVAELAASKQAQLSSVSQLETEQVHALLAGLTRRVAGFCWTVGLEVCIHLVDAQLSNALQLPSNKCVLCTLTVPPYEWYNGCCGVMMES